MTRERANDLLRYWPIIIALILTAMYIQRLDSRVSVLERDSNFMHGDIEAFINTRR